MALWPLTVAAAFKGSSPTAALRGSLRTAPARERASVHAREEARAQSGRPLKPRPTSGRLPPLDLVRLRPLMERTGGRPEVVIALLDGPIATRHPELAASRIREIPGRLQGTCARASSAACMHGTFVAAILSAQRGSLAPAICPGCTLLVRPIFAETATQNGDMPGATPEDLASAIVDAVEAGARLINISAAIRHSSAKGALALTEALDHAMRGGVITVAAAGNARTIGGTVITAHPSVIPAVACDLRGRTLNRSNLGHSIGRRGMSAPGEGITSLGAAGGPLTLEGTSAAAPFVTGATALLWSEFPAATAAQVTDAVTRARGTRRTTVVPPLLDACAADKVLRAARTGG